MAIFVQDHFHVTNANPRKAAQFYIECLGAKIVNEVSRSDRLIINLDISGIPYRISYRTGADDNLVLNSSSSSPRQNYKRRDNKALF